MNYTTLWALPLFLLPLSSTAQYGVLDLTFNGTGYLENGQGIGSNATRDLLARANGDIVAAISSNYGMQTNQVSSDGVLDTDWFTYAGSTGSNLPNGQLVEQPDGMIVLATKGETDPAEIRLVRYTTEGVEDPAFGTDGVVLHPIPTASVVRIGAFERLSDGKFLLAGTAQAANEQVLVARFLADGSWDTSFNGTGLLLVDVANGAAAEDMALRPDGRIVLGGYALQGTTEELLLMQLLADGTMDASFGTAGVVIADLGFSAQTIRGIALTPNGGIVVAGWVTQSATDTDAMLASFQSSGLFDNDFDSDGWLLAEDVEDYDRFFDVLLDEDDMILACGVAGPINLPQVRLTRRALNGSVDPTFGAGGTTTTAFEYGGIGRCMALQDDGKILVGGTLAGSFYALGLVARFSGGMPTGIHALEAPGPLVVLPNPATDRIQLSLPSFARAQQLRLHDASGRMVHREQLGGTDRAVVDVSGLAEGTYQLVLTDGGTVYRGSFMVVR